MCGVTDTGTERCFVKDNLPPINPPPICTATVLSPILVGIKCSILSDIIMNSLRKKPGRVKDLLEIKSIIFVWGGGLQLPRPTRGELRAHWVSVSQHRWYNDVDNGDVLSIITDCPLDLPQNVLTISILLSKDSPCFDLYTIHLSIILQTLQCSYGCLFSYQEELNRWPCRSLCHSIYFGTY